jgi:hypothetical protein
VAGAVAADGDPEEAAPVSAREVETTVAPHVGRGHRAAHVGGRIWTDADLPAPQDWNNPSDVAEWLRILGVVLPDGVRVTRLVELCARGVSCTGFEVRFGEVDSA